MEKGENLPVLRLFGVDCSGDEGPVGLLARILAKMFVPNVELAVTIWFEAPGNNGVEPQGGGLLAGGKESRTCEESRNGGILE